MASDSHNPPDARDVVWELEAENARLREALKEIAALDADDADPGFAESPDYWAGVGAATYIARAALSGPAPNEDRG